MARLSISVEAQFGGTWPAWKRRVAAIEDLGFSGLYRSDHLVSGDPPTQPSLEMIVSLAYAADHTRRIPIGTLVTPFTFRDPAMLALQAAAIDDLSEGRFTLGVGAGDWEPEHRMLGFRYDDTPTRLARFADGLDVLTKLLRSDEPVTHDGPFYQLSGALLLPRPTRPGGPGILIGGNSAKSILRLAARHADVWNGFWLTPEDFRDRCTRLDELLTEAGRDHQAVRRSVALLAIFGRDRTELEEQAAGFRRWRPDLAELSFDDLADRLRAEHRVLIGGPEEFLAVIQGYAEAGAEEVVLHRPDIWDEHILEAMATHVLPRAVG
jgi:alkanesulfonate monooxygenase SsuD/methylene tetrahydromethanopterin reductase-like flavin-dependent oxidoreductase (luciferase family)